MEYAKVKRLPLPPGRRVLAISDIHGNLPLFRGLLNKVGFSREDILILLGDILERSEGSLATLQYVMALARTHTVYAVCGNCDDLTVAFVDELPYIPPAFYPSFLGGWREKSTICQMARLAGAPIRGPEDYPAAREAIRARFPEELSFLRGLPTILVNNDYLFVHGGVPREERLGALSIHMCMKNDDFLGQGRSFRRWVVVGHWPVTLYHPHVPCSNPILLEDRHIASIDGGCTLNADGQLNALILPSEPGGAFSWVSYDGLPTVTALDRQAPSDQSVNIRYGHSAVEVLRRGEEFSLCRHLESGRVLEILTSYLYRRRESTCCWSFTDHRLAVEPGDTLSVVRRTSRGLLAKKGGVTGWYAGAWEENC